MALHKEPNGLIYNDDGSLCVTLREDDVPFAGVKSFAVLSWDEFLDFDVLPEDLGTGWVFFGDPTYRSISGGIMHFNDTSTAPGKFAYYQLNTSLTSSSKVTVEVKTTRIVSNSDGWQPFFEIADGTNRGIVRLFPDHIEFSGAATVQYAVDMTAPHIVRLVKDANSWSVFLDGALVISNQAGIGAGGWNRLVFGHGSSSGTGESYWDYYCYTLNGAHAPDPYASYGIVKLTNPPLPLDNFVINLWFKPTRYPSQTNQWWHLFDVSYNASALQALELCAPPSVQRGIPSNTLSLTVRNSSSTFIRYNLGFDLSAEIGKWHMITLISNGSIVDVYIDGEKRVSATNDIQRSAIEFIVFGRYFGNVSGTGMENGFLMANVLFASYDPNIWNDDYIQALYDAKKPFAVPPRLPII